MSQIDYGGAYRLEYLGSVMLTSASTGLGMLQKPLREKYFKYRQSNFTSSEQRDLALTAKGMVVAFQQNPASMPEEVFYPMPNIVFWDAVQFVTVKGRDKKHKGAFEPLDLDHSRNKDNLFSAIEKKFNFITKLSHPPMFICALRRTEGPKLIDVHIYVCTTVDEALSILHGLNDLQNIANHEGDRSGMFDYNPYGVSVGGRSHDNSPNSTVNPPYQGQPFAGRNMGGPGGYPPSDRGSQFGDMSSQFSDRGSDRGGEFEDPRERAKSPISPKPRFGVPAIGPQTGVPAALVGAPRPPKRHAHEQPLPPAPNYPAPTRPQSYNLTQEDFYNPQGQYRQDNQWQSDPRQLRSPIPEAYPTREHGRYDASGNNTYEYIRHIDHEGGPGRGNRPTEPAEHPASGSVYTTTLATRPPHPVHADYREDYNSMSRDMYIQDSTIQPGYPPRPNGQDNDHYMHTIQGERAGNRFDQFPTGPSVPDRTNPNPNAYRPPENRPYNEHLPERELLREYAQNQRGNVGYGKQAPERSNENQRPVSLMSEQQSPSRPVAMVQPRKLQGVKVLPNMPISPLRDSTSPNRDSVSSTDSGNRNSSYLSPTTDIRNFPSENNNRTPYSAKESNNKSENNTRPSYLTSDANNKNSAYSSDGISPPNMAYKDYHDNREVKREQGKKNWQFGGPKRDSSEINTLKAPEDPNQFKTTDEERHRRMKKEAELANVFQELEVDDRTFKMSDFEKGLGYLP